LLLLLLCFLLSSNSAFFVHTKYLNGGHGVPSAANCDTLSEGTGDATSGKLFTGLPLRASMLQQHPMGGSDRSGLSWARAQAAAASCNPKVKFAAVVTTIAAEPTRAILELAKARPDIQVIVIADRKSPGSWASIPPNIKYVTVSQQEQEYDGAFQPPWNHFGRKNIGYLEALKTGACFIWDFDDDNILLDNHHGVLSEDSLRQWAKHSVEVSAPAARGQDVATRWVNLMPIMGNTEFIWPRGSPLEPVQQRSMFLPRLQALQACANAAAQSPSCIPIGPDCRCLGLLSTLAQGNPDLDAIQRLTAPAPVHFSRELGSMISLAGGSTMSHNAQATLISRTAIMFGMLPMTVHGRVSDIWRAIILNRLCELYGVAVAVTSGTVIHIRNKHSYLADLDAEQPLYAQANVLADVLAAWQPRNREQLGATMVELYDMLYVRGVVQAADVDYQRRWVGALNRVLSPSDRRLTQHVHAGVPAQPGNRKAPLIKQPGHSSPRRLLTQAAVVAHPVPLLNVAVAVSESSMPGIPSWLAVYGHFFKHVVFVASNVAACHAHAMPVSANVSVICASGGFALGGVDDPAAHGERIWPAVLQTLKARDQSDWLFTDINVALQMAALLKGWTSAERTKHLSLLASQWPPAKQAISAKWNSASGALTSADTKDARASDIAATLTAAAKRESRIKAHLDKCAKQSVDVPLHGFWLGVIRSESILAAVDIAALVHRSGVPGDVAVSIALTCGNVLSKTSTGMAAQVLSATGLWHHAQTASKPE
jgi:hypothetical protein